MPNARTVEKINTSLTMEAVNVLADDAEFVRQVSQPGAFLGVAQQLLSLTDAELGYLSSIPTVLQEAIRAGVADAVAQRKGIQVQYAPGYDFAVQVWDFGEAVGIHLTGPYPIDFPQSP